MCNNTIADTVSAELIVVRQLPVIEERLRTMKETVDQRVSNALAMVCTEETIQAVKAERANLNREFAILEEKRKDAKKAVLDPYERFEAVYKECVSDAFKRADAALKKKISDIESEMKRRCEEGLREYFAELSAVHHLEWLRYEQARITVDMASAKGKTPSKLRKQLLEFVVRVKNDVELIDLQEDAAEIMEEYRRTLDAPRSICTVKERHWRIDEERAAKDARAVAKDTESKSVEKVIQAQKTYLQPPVTADPSQEKDPNEIIPRCMFTALCATRAQLQKLKKFMDMEGIRYE